MLPTEREVSSIPFIFKHSPGYCEKNTISGICGILGEARKQPIDTHYRHLFPMEASDH